MNDDDATSVRLREWQEELSALSITFRWGETRRFHSNTKKIARRNWLISHIAAATTQKASHE